MDKILNLVTAQKDTRENGVPHPWAAQLNIAKVNFSHAHQQIKNNPIKITATHFQELYKLACKFIWNNKDSRRPKGSKKKTIQETEEKFQNRTKMIEVPSKFREEMMSALGNDALVLH